MDKVASQITSLAIVYLTVYSDADQRKHQSSASLAFVRGIHRGPVNSPHKWPVTRKMFPFDDVIMGWNYSSLPWLPRLYNWNRWSWAMDEELLTLLYVDVIVYPCFGNDVICFLSSVSKRDPEYIPPIQSFVEGRTAQGVRWLIAWMKRVLVSFWERPGTQGLYSLSNKAFYRQIYWGLEAARLDVIIIISL